MGAQVGDEIQGGAQDDRTSELLKVAPSSVYSEQQMPQAAAPVQLAGDDMATPSGKVQVSVNGILQAPNHFR